MTITGSRFTQAAVAVSLWTYVFIAQASGDDSVQTPILSDSGAATFRQYCTDCHDAQRSLRKTKSLSDWMATVRRMADMEDADIPEEVHNEIARYLALNARAPARSPQEARDNASGDEARSRDGGENAAKANDSAGQRFDASVVQAGETAFNRYCVSCHDAQKSLQASKNLAAWQTTVRRMASKPDANIPANVHTSIATYLASRTQGAQGATGANAGAASAADGGSQSSVWATVSPMWRGGNGKAAQDSGFFPSLWVGATWQQGAVSARATACTTCHAQNEFGLVEAAIRFNISKYLQSRCNRPSESEPGADVAIDAGRFVVPFGAFYQQVNPGVYRTVSLPLIYNMGQRVDATNQSSGTFGFPVLPMPYSDTGANLSIGLPIAENANATLDAYIVNGLQGSASGVDFIQTYQQFFSLNSQPAGGGRFSIGGQHLRLGASVMSGRFNRYSTTPALDYLIFGADAVFRWKDVLRVQFEYAQRNSQRLGSVPAAVFTERVGGCYLEAEALLSRHWHMSFLARYDSQATQSLLPPPGSTLTNANFMVQRFTYGLNWALPGGSLLMVNHEHWYLPQGLGTVDIAGVRWAATF